MLTCDSFALCDRCPAAKLGEDSPVRRAWDDWLVRWKLQLPYPAAPDPELVASRVVMDAHLNTAQAIQLFALVDKWFEGCAVLRDGTLSPVISADELPTEADAVKIDRLLAQLFQV